MTNARSPVWSCDSAVRHLCVDLSRDAGRCDVQMKVVLLVQTQITVTEQVESVDTPEETEPPLVILGERERTGSTGGGTGSPGREGED